ncbi:hypothetical protein SAMN05192558_12016 [Actinokineospora alba]|uniref:4-amino-4-deoxy-L-arabinose transferase n=1 Tax=Actinokineospora alba TaxID=504798 RepID=A0A1H0WDB8_9PSEU|nr:DUF2079 domain-containing protein [Actinokineospora alba]TDP68871.1 hypothetical protein C8E96_4438 [Actinokineospora alba]SDI73970.1 hypothetical protein SAMN05421871_107141 [Actinokineospora alba]SDP88750.1 hypothetical protein SAMN05192558_12016 [Actinokineospora alba]
MIVTSTEAVVDQREPADSRPRLGWMLYLSAAVPPMLALWQVIRGTRQHVLLDYWHVLAKVTADDGSLQPAMAATYHLEQPFVLPSLIFWLDARVLGGDNRVLGVLTLLLLVGVVAALGSMLPRSLPRPLLVAGFSLLVFTPHAIELWAQATNGISWAPAVFLSVLAIACAHHGRIWPSYVAAGLGTLSFGTALPVWFALALVAWIRGESRRRVAVPAAVGVVVIVLWLASKPTGQNSLATSAFDPSGRLAVVSAALGSLWTSKGPDLAVIAGGGLLVAVALLTLGRLRPREAGWVGLAGYAVAVACLIGLGRTTAGENIGLVSRYSIVAALATCAVIGLVAMRETVRVRHLAAGVLAIGLITHAIGAPKAADVRRAYAPLEVADTALRVEAPGALAELRINSGVIPAAKALGMEPFTGDFALGCGFTLGDRVDLRSIRELPAGAGVVDTKMGEDRVQSGWTAVEGHAAECVLVVDDAGALVGGGIAGLAHPGVPWEAGWRAVARPDSANPAIVAVVDGNLYRVDNDVS